MLRSSRKQAQSRFLEKFSPEQLWLAPARLAVLVGVAYFLAARLSLYLQNEPDGVAVFWPAAGVSSGILIALGRDPRWPTATVRWSVALGVMAATIAAKLVSDRTVWASIALAMCNAGETLLVAWLIERYVGRDFTLNRMRHVAIFLGVAIAASAISGVGGALAYHLLHSPDVPALITWRHWFASHVIGIITVAPLMIGLVSLARVRTPRLELVEGIAALAAIAATTAVIIFLLPEIWWDIVVPVELLFPLLLWLSARCRPAFTSAAIFVVSLMIICAITFDIGHFGTLGSTTEAGIWGAQAGILGIALCALLLAAVFAERRKHAAVAAAVLNTVEDAIITIDHEGSINDLNPAAARVFGYSSEEVIGRNVKMLMPEPYRREHDGYLSNYLRTNKAKMIGLGREVAGRRKDGSIFPMELAVSEMMVSRRRMFTGVVRDITERKQVERHQDLLVAELDHRVKNVLAQVAVVAMSTRQGSHSVDEFLRSLNGRIQSMAAAHTLLSKSGWQSVGLDALVRNQLAPYATGTNVTISGTDVMLIAAEIQAVARVLHELVTNAAKYGALSIPDGHVSVSWDRKRNGDGTNLMLVWQEQDGPPVKSEIRSSYGTNLIRNLIPHELGGMVELKFASEGVSCRIEMPIRQVELLTGAGGAFRG
jgi:PAS domain S-box-containing protein